MKTIKLKLLLPERVFQLIVLLTTLFALSCSQPNMGKGNSVSNFQDTLSDNKAEPTFNKEDCNIIVGEPLSYKGLEIFPISLLNNETGLNYIILAEAIAQKKLIIEETGDVNQLTVSNVSDTYIFIMAGDIIKGGKQDRTLGVDAIIPPRAKKVPIESYCVESGRWKQRGSENVKEFSENTKVLSSRKLKLASKYKKNQSEVWQNVADQQEKLNKNISKLKGGKVDVRSEESESSLQLTLESKDLNDIIDEYKKNLIQLYNSDKRLSGFAYAINGELYGIDIFNDPELFKQLSAKLYEAVIVEAISEYVPEDTIKSLDTEAVYKLYLHNFNNTSQKTNVNEVTEMSTFDSKEAVLFETANYDNKLWVHKNYIPKNEDDNNNRLNKGLNPQRLNRFCP